MSGGLCSSFRKTVMLHHYCHCCCHTSCRSMFSSDHGCLEIIRSPLSPLSCSDKLPFSLCGLSDIASVISDLPVAPAVRSSAEFFKQNGQLFREIVNVNLLIFRIADHGKCPFVATDYHKTFSRGPGVEIAWPHTPFCTGGDLIGTGVRNTLNYSRFSYAKHFGGYCRRFIFRNILTVGKQTCYRCPHPKQQISTFHLCSGIRNYPNVRLSANLRQQSKIYPPQLLIYVKYVAKHKSPTN